MSPEEAKSVAERALAPLVAHGDASYGEGVTVMAHSLQAAAQAQREATAEDRAQTVAALLHDVGHGLVGDQEHYQE